MSAQGATTTQPPGGGANRAANAEQAGQRVEEAIDRLTAAGDAQAAAAAEELVRVLMDFYGAGLARILALLDAPEAGRSDGSKAVTRLLGDELVSSLLVLHDLHPEDTATRIARALDTVPGQSVEVVSFDDTSGTLRLRSAESAGCGCASTAAAGQQAMEDALACFAPEVTAVVTEPAASSRGPALLQIGTRPSADAAGTGPASAKAL